LLSTKLLPGAVLDPGDSAVNRCNKAPSLQYFLEAKSDNEQINKHLVSREMTRAPKKTKEGDDGKTVNRCGRLQCGWSGRGTPEMNQNEMSE
jgi:hypothetical protein